MKDQENTYTDLNAFPRTPCFTQIASYVFLGLVDICFWAFIQPHFVDSMIRFGMIVAFSISFIVLIASGLITSIIDPSDPMVVESRKGNNEKVMKNMKNCLYCDHCNNYVLSTSRHCKKCDRCIHKFDHHCIWINNCIGNFNYAFFIFMIYSAVSHLFLFILSLSLLWNQQQWQSYLGQMVFNWIISFISIIFILLLIGLIVLHMYLIYKGQTTYEYIMAKKIEGEMKKVEKAFGENMQIESRSQEKNIEKPSSQQLQVSNETHKTQNGINGIHQPVSAFININRMQESSENSHTIKKQKERMWSRNGQFQMLEIIHHESEQSQQRQVSKIFKRNKSLKILVGDSIVIRSRKNSSSQASECSKKSINFDKVSLKHCRQSDYRSQGKVDEK